MPFHAIKMTAHTLDSLQLTVPPPELQLHFTIYCLYSVCTLFVLSPFWVYSLGAYQAVVGDVALFSPPGLLIVWG